MRYLWILSLLSMSVEASIPQEILSLRNQAMSNMQSFNPEPIPSSTQNPDISALLGHGKLKPLDEQSPEIQVGNQLIEKAVSIEEQRDETVTEESDDIHEGVTKLGALGESAEASIQGQFVSIFRGEKQECERFILGTRDCCKDSGFLDGVLHCPAALQGLQRAKLENRVVYLGHYKNSPIAATRYVYCVFPTKLAGIVQTQGRWNQLHISFGSAKKPNCRGINADELSQINFKALDLSALTTEYMTKQRFPKEMMHD